jgi:hypothetical protein
MKHVVMFSGGVGSWAAAKRVAEQHGTNDLVLLFADVGGDSCVCTHRSSQHINGRGPCDVKVDGKYCRGCSVFTRNPHVGEDEDCYRFVHEGAKNVGGQLVILNEGRTIWEVFKDDRFLGNSRLANCSKFLKQRPAHRFLEDNCDPTDTAVYVGIDWMETHRLPAIEKAYAPIPAFAPLTEPPYLDKEDMLKWCIAEGLLPPRMYAQKYPHANCGGGCVRAGQGQFKLLFETNPERFAYWEAQEQELRDYLDKDVSILKDRRGGTTKPLPLSVFRQQLTKDNEGITDADDIGGCGCFVDENNHNQEDDRHDRD